MKARQSEIRIVTDPDSKTGLSAIILVRDIKLRGPFRNGAYRLVKRTIKGRRSVPCGTQKRVPVAKIEINCPASQNEWKAELHNRRMERARAMSPMLK